MSPTRGAPADATNCEMLIRGRVPFAAPALDALDADGAAKLRELAAAGVTKAALAREFGISRGTVYAYLRTKD